MAKLGQASSGFRTPPRRPTFGVEDRLAGLEDELAKTQSQLADAQATERRYNLLEGAGETLTRESMQSTKESALKTLAELEAAGQDSGEYYNRVAQIAETGAPYQEKNFLGKAIGLLDIPTRLIKAGIVDATGLDEKMGKEISFRDDFFDIISQRDSALRRRNAGFSDEDGKWSDDIFNTSRIMEELGWEKSDSAFGKFVRGAGQFGAEVLMDPLSYLTGGASAVGKSVLRSTAKNIIGEGAEAAIEGAIKGAARNADDPILKRLADLATENRQVYDDALEEFGDPTTALDLLSARVKSIAEGDVMGPLLKKDFDSLPEWFSKSSRVKKQAPYLQGGLRFTPNPFGNGLKGASPIPGTVGAGRRMTRFTLGTRAGTQAKGFLGKADEAGTGLAGALSKAGVFDWGDDMLNKIDNTRPAWKLAALGTPEGQRIADVMTEGLATLAAETGTRDLSNSLNQVMRQWSDSIAKVSDEKHAEVGRVMVEGIQQGAFQPEHIDEALASLPDWMTDAQKAATVAAAQKFQETTTNLRRMASQAGIDMGTQDNYVPFIWDQGFANALGRMADKAPAIDPELAPEHLKDAVAWLSEAVAARQRRTGGVGAAVGETAHARARSMGKEVTVRDVNGITIVDGAPGVDLTFATHAEMNDQIKEAAEWLARENNLALPKFDNALDMNPASMMNRYMSSMADAIHERALVRKLREVGGVRKATFRADVGRVVAGVIQDVKGPKQQAALENLIDRVQGALIDLAEDFDEPYRRTRKVRVGPLGTVDLPARATRANDKQLNRHLDAAGRKAKALNAANSSLRASHDAAVRRLTARGVDESVAEAIASSMSRRELKNVARRARDVAVKEAREEAEVLLDVARRMDTATEATDQALRTAQRQADSAVREAERSARKAERKIHKEVANDMRSRRTAAFPPQRFETPEARTAISDVFRADLADQLNDLEMDLGAEAGEIFDDLIAALGGGNPDEIGAALNEALAVGRRRLQETAKVPDEKLDSMRGIALEATHILERTGFFGGGDMAKRMRNAPLRPGTGEQTLWDLVKEAEQSVSDGMRTIFQSNKGNMTSGVKKMINEMQEAAGKFSEILGNLEEAANAIPPHWQIARQLEGHDLVGELHALRKIALGQKVMHDAGARMGLERMLRRAGMIGEEVSLSANPKTPLGFELLDNSERWAPVDQALESARRQGVESVQEAGLIDDALATDPDTWVNTRTGREVPTTPVGLGQREVEALFPRHLAETPSAVVGEGLTRARREVGTDGSVGWVVRNEAGDPLAWVLVDGRRGVTQGMREAAIDMRAGSDDLVTHLNRVAKEYGDIPPEGVISDEAAADLWNRLRTAGNNIGKDELRTIREAGSLPDYVRRIGEIEQAVKDATRRNLSDPTLRDLKSTRDTLVQQQEALNSLRENVLRPLSKKTATQGELATAARSLRKLRPQLEGTLAPLDFVNLDLLADRVGKMEALAAFADGSAPEALRLIDSANNLRTTYFDPETTVRSIRDTAEDIHRGLNRDATQEQIESLKLVQDMNEVLRRLLAVSQDEAGNSRRGFLSAQEQEAVTKLMDDGKKAWNNLGLKGKDSPFHVEITPTAERPRFVPPSHYGLAGQLDESAEVIDRYAGEWLQNTLAIMGSAHLPENISALGRNVQQITNWWKAAATVSRPSFHVRNVVGGLWNGMYADVRMRDYKAAIQNTIPFLNALRRTGSPDEALDALPEAIRPFFRGAWDAGVFDDTFASTEILGRTVNRQKRTHRYNPLSVDGPVVRAGGETMMGLEGNMRMAVFMRHFNPEADDLTRSAAMAKSWVDMVHFNYADLTQVEQSLRRYIPFFVWFRRNLPLQLRTLVENPRMIQRYNHLISSVDGQGDDLQTDDLPHSMYREGTMFASLGLLNGETDFPTRVLFDPDLPINVLEDVSLSPSSWFSLMANQLGPQFDVATLFANEGEDYKVTAPGGISQLINVLPNAVVKKLGAEKNVYGAPRLSARASQIWRLVLPQINELGGSVLEQAPNRRQGLGQLPTTEVGGDDSFMSDVAGHLGRTVGRGLGVQLEGVDDGYSAAVSAGFDIGSIRSELRKQGILTPEAEKAVEDANANLDDEQKLAELQAFLDKYGSK